MPSKLRPFEEVKAVILAAHDEWFGYLGLDATWSVFISFVDPKELDDEDDEAETQWASYYRTAKTKYNKKAILSMVNEELRQLVLHENCHLLFADTWDFINGEFGKGNIRDRLLQQEEKNVDILTRVILRFDNERTEDNDATVEAGSDGNTPQGDVGSVRWEAPHFGFGTPTTRSNDAGDGRPVFTPSKDY